MIKTEPKAQFFKLCSYQSGMRSTHYSCYCAIYDEKSNLIKDHPLQENYEGKWAKCRSLLNKWEKVCKKNGLTRIYK